MRESNDPWMDEIGFWTIGSTCSYAEAKMSSDNRFSQSSRMVTVTQIAKSPGKLHLCHRLYCFNARKPLECLNKREKCVTLYEACA